METCEWERQSSRLCFKRSASFLITNSGGRVQVGCISAHWMWPQVSAQQHNIPEEERKPCFVVTTQEDTTGLACYSDFTCLMRVMAWVLRFIHNSRSETSQTGPLSVDELTTAETLWILKSQSHTFLDKIEAPKQKKTISSTSCLHSLHSFLDSSGVLWV